MKVLLMLSGIAMGGTERNIVSFSPFLKKAGAEVFLCTLNKRRDSPLAEIFSHSGVERIDLGARRMIDLHAIRRFRTLLREKKIDIVHAEDQDSIIYAGLARRLFGVPSVMTRHVMEEPTSSVKSKIRARLVYLSARYGINGVVAVSNVVREHFSKQAYLSLSKIRTIYNGIELEKFDIKDSQANLRLKLGWNIGRPLAVFISVLRPGKGFEVLFKAIPKILEVLPDFQVNIVGDGDLDAELRRQAEPFGDAVHFMGQRMDVPQLIRASDVLIQASWSEALPTVLIEAGAASIPAVATNVGGTAEIILDGKSGFLIDPGDAESLANRTIEILLSQNLREQMGKNARDYVFSVFSLEKQANQTIAYYDDILSGKS